MISDIVKKFVLCGFFIGFAALGTVVQPQHAAGEDFYKGKTIRVIIRSSASGGGNDFYGRLIARHLPRYLPGKPNAIAVNMPGASGIVAANYIYNRAKRDGTEIGILARAIAIAQRTGVKGVDYDVRKLNALGSVSSDTAVFVAAGNSKYRSLKELKRGGPKVKVATTGVTGGAYQRSMVLRHDGFPMEMITGYADNNEKVMAVVRGEVDITAGSLSTIISAVKDEKFRIIGKLGPAHPDIPAGTPDLRDVVTGEQRTLAQFLVAPLEAGRPFYAPPELPKERLATVRAAFKAVLADAELLKEAARAKRTIQFISPAQMAATNQEVLNTPIALVEKFKKLKGKKPVKTYNGAITALADGNKLVTMKRDNGKILETKLSGSRTAVMVGGKKVKRKALKVGMVCAISAPGNKSEAKTVDCK